MSDPIFVPVWAVHTKESDRDCGVPTYFFSSKLAADAAAQGRGWYGGTATVSSHYAVLIDGKYYRLVSQFPFKLDADITALEREQAKAAALAKLTDKEKALLGLTDTE